MENYEIEHQYQRMELQMEICLAFNASYMSIGGQTSQRSDTLEKWAREQRTIESYLDLL